MPEQMTPASLARLPDLIDDGPGNMATDLAMLMLQAHAPGGAAFRAYGWSEPTITFGLSQPFTAVRTLLGEGDGILRLVRRPTGGGVVDHRDDWTYALALSAQVKLARAAPVEIYREVHRCLADAIRDSGGAAVMLVPCPRLCGAVTTPASVSVCFKEPVADDLALAGSGAKVAGAAMKRGREGVLIQGSVQPGLLFGGMVDATRKVLFQAFAAHLADCLELGMNAGNPAPETTEIPLGSGWSALRERFTSDAWTKRR